MTWRKLLYASDAVPTHAHLQADVTDFDHALVGADHTASGLTPGHVLTALTATTFGFQLLVAAVVAKTAHYTATLADEVILVSAANGAVTITLPAASTATGKRYTIKKTDIGTNTITIDANGSELIDGALTAVISDYLEAVTVICDGVSWWVV